MLNRDSLKKPSLQMPAPRPNALAQSSAARGEFRLFLQAELVARCKANPKYSLRAFARHLGLESSRLSKMLRGERPISPKYISELGFRLGLSPQQIEAFCAQERVRKGQTVRSAPHRAALGVQLSQDVFGLIEDWRHNAVLELMKVRAFQATPQWIARALGVTVSEARAYIERLQRVDLLEVRSDGNWIDRTEGASTNILSDLEATQANRRAQRAILNMAAEAMDRVPMVRRDQSSMMMATHSSKILEAKERIKNFRRELCAFLEDAEVKDSVYQLSVSLFPPFEIENLQNKKGSQS